MTLVAKTFTPPEAKAIAAEFRQAAQELRTSSAELTSMGAHLEPQWLGNSKQEFFFKFNKRPKELLSLASWLLECARRIENIKVTIWVEG